LTSQKLDIKERLSYVEDIDLTELLVKLEQQQITYQTVLQSASKIMNMSLASYL
jgi:flagellar hook-associated protein 3 FlgL